MSGLWLVSYGIRWVLLIVIAVVLLSLMRNIGLLQQRLEQATQPPAPSIYALGDAIRSASVQTLAGTPIDLATLNGTSRALVVISPHCGPCHDVVHHLTTTTDRTDPFGLGVEQTVLISVADRDTVQTSLQEHGLDPQTVTMYCDPMNTLADQWGIRATPTFLTIDAHGKITGQRSGFAPLAHSTAP